MPAPRTHAGAGETPAGARPTALDAVAREAVDAAMARGADAADARVVRVSTERLALRNGAVAEASAPEEFGIGVRVFKDGAV
ncbi:MAG: DNA gyrase modulator, partial [Planctomycetota bacterium]